MAAEFSCVACSEAFGNATDQRAHCKSERHVYNTKRRLAGLKPISQEAWERKLRESRAALGEESKKGKAHLKAGKEPKAKGGGYNAGGSPPAAPGAEAEAPEAAKEAAPEEAALEPYAPERCLFDRRKFGSADACLEYMWKTYSFSVPDREYCTDLTGLLTHLHRKFTEAPHECMYCNRRFLDAAAANRHMLHMRHTRMGTQARTRRGKVCKNRSEDLEAEYEKFFDFTGSTREITERMRDPLQKAASILRFFDEDRDGFLKFKELAALWSAANEGAVLSAEVYAGACVKAGAEPGEGLDEKALHNLYAEGLADLDLHFAMLQDALTRRLTERRKARREAEPPEEGDEAAEEAAEEEEDGGEEDGVDDEEDGDSDGTEVLECDDEEEFEEVMRVLGLQPVKILDSGDLQLPNGRTVCNRDVAYIWRQRGVRHAQLDIVPGLPKSGPSVRTPLMLTANAHGAPRIAMSHRAQAKEGKKMVAILKYENLQKTRLGLHTNILMRKHSVKIRTTFGDASGGR